MVISHSPNYLFSNKVNNIDNHTLVKDCLDIEKMLLTTFTNIDRKGYGCLSTAHHEKYNMLTFSTKEIQDLYYELQNLISPYLENKTYLIKIGIAIGNLKKRFGTVFIVFKLVKVILNIKYLVLKKL